MSAQTQKKFPDTYDAPTVDVAASLTTLKRDWQADKYDAPDNSGHVYDSIIDLAPNPDNPTPMVRLSERTNPHSDYEVLVKLEGMNPFGSIKDRTAL